MSNLAWDEESISWGWNKTVDLRFLADMTGDLCMSDHRDSWDQSQHCIRIQGHTGRHLAAEWNCRYPTAVW